MNILNDIILYIKDLGFVVQFLVFMSVIFLLKMMKVKKLPNKTLDNTEDKRREMDAYLASNKISNPPPVNLIERSCKSDNPLILFGAHALLANNTRDISYDEKHCDDSISDEQESSCIASEAITEEHFCSSDLNSTSGPDNSCANSTPDISSDF
ncbi:hypothetical protein [Aliivibrio fischeri]|uniref:hypothetical protein n=1 Tax=Aliivibrio fischeri TaxID=668 RepID=UPI0012D96930|nr:hypothetical protein [Aliivibrio fischeri]MUJ20408.1 hypothetical protein [Aliivibrio fischeri]